MKKFLAWDIVADDARNTTGMPSGHAASSIYDTYYLCYLKVVPIFPWVIFSFVTYFITIYERYQFRNHTINQLLCGTILGLIVAYATFAISDIMCPYTGNCQEKRLLF